MRYAVGFKTHAWDPFIARQYDRYRRIVGNGDLFVIADETRGTLDIPDDIRVIRTTNAGLVGMGLADAYGKGGLIWWNTDYPNYVMFERHPDYDYYLFAEYDTCINRPVDELMADIAARGLDYVGLPNRTDLADWYWTPFHERAYPRAALRGALNSIVLFSRPAMHLLLERRRAMARQHAAGTLKFWPMNEVFIPTEIELAGLASASIETLGDASHYEWHPPHLEEDLEQLRGHTFLHPVLDRWRYIASLLKFEFDLSAYFSASSSLRRALSRFPPGDYLPQMPGAFRRQVMVKIRQGLGNI